MSAGPIVIILGPYPRRVTAGETVDTTSTIERYVTISIEGLDADPSASDVEDALSLALEQTESRMSSVPFNSLPPTE